LPDYHSYLKREEDKTIVYYHFVGDSLQQKLTLSEDGTTVLSVESVGSQDSNIARIKFYDINWEYRHFISKEEFETIWKKMVNIFTDDIRYALTLLSKSGKITVFRH